MTACLQASLPDRERGHTGAEDTWWTSGRANLLERVVHFLMAGYPGMIDKGYADLRDIA